VRQLDPAVIHSFLELDHIGLKTAFASICRIGLVKFIRLVFAKLDSHANEESTFNSKVNPELAKSHQTDNNLRHERHRTNTI
jgi:hypothetical protein